MTDLSSSIGAALPDYEVQRELGRGAMGVVYLGRHRRLGRDVAIKEIAGPLADDPEVRSRFLTEARVLASLDHPHVVPVYDYVEEAGRCLLIMEALGGGTVWDRFRRDGLTLASACAITLATCAAVDHAHRKGVLHRDIKPENLMLSAAGDLKVTDFGIAKVLDGGHTMATVDGSVLGTPAYMAPEQAEGTDVGPAADVYAIGTMLYEFLSGRLPYQGDSPMALLVARLTADAPPLSGAAPGVPRPVAEVVDRSLARSVDERFAGPADLGRSLHEAVTASIGAGWLDQAGLTVIAAGLAAPTLPPTAAAPSGSAPATVAPATGGAPGTVAPGTVAPTGPGAPDTVAPAAHQAPGTVAPTGHEAPGTVAPGTTAPGSEGSADTPSTIAPRSAPSAEPGEPATVPPTGAVEPPTDDVTGPTPPDAGPAPAPPPADAEPPSEVAPAEPAPAGPSPAPATTAPVRPAVSVHEPAFDLARIRRDDLVGIEQVVRPHVPIRAPLLVLLGAFAVAVVAVLLAPSDPAGSDDGLGGVAFAGEPRPTDEVSTVDLSQPVAVTGLPGEAASVELTLSLSGVDLPSATAPAANGVAEVDPGLTGWLVHGPVEVTLAATDAAGAPVGSVTVPLISERNWWQSAQVPALLLLLAFAAATVESQSRNHRRGRVRTTAAVAAAVGGGLTAAAAAALLASFTERPTTLTALALAAVPGAVAGVALTVTRARAARRRRIKWRHAA
jgi:serine/threonine-protein kinase